MVTCVTLAFSSWIYSCLQYFGLCDLPLLWQWVELFSSRQKKFNLCQIDRMRNRKHRDELQERTGVFASRGSACPAALGTEPSRPRT